MKKGEKRRLMRRLAMQTFATAAVDMGLSRRKFAKLVKAEDEDALAAFAAAAPDEALALGIDWDDIDLDAFWARVLKFIEALVLIFAMF